MFALCACERACVCVPVQMSPPYYSWLVDGCWLSHLHDFVPARCGGVTGIAPKHSSISTIVQQSFGAANSFQYPLSCSRCRQKCLHTQKRGDWTYWPALSVRVDEITNNVTESWAVCKGLVTNKSLTLHLLCKVVIVIRLAVKGIEFGVFPKVAVEQVPERILRPQVLITSKPNRGALEAHKQNGSKYTLAVLKVWQRIQKQNNVDHFSQEHTILPLWTHQTQLHLKYTSGLEQAPRGEARNVISITLARAEFCSSLDRKQQLSSQSANGREGNGDTKCKSDK